MRFPRNKIVGWVLIAAMAGLVVWGVVAMWRERQRGLWHNIARTRSTMMNIQVLCAEANLLAKTEPTVDPASILRLHEADAMEHYNVDQQSGLTLDEWGTPIHLRPSPKPGIAVLMSYGPNRRDDGGTKDDIVMECETCDVSILPVLCP